jgi:ribosomal protein S27E
MMIGIGTPRSQSRMPRPMRPSFMNAFAKERANSQDVPSTSSTAVKCAYCGRMCEKAPQD